MTPDHLRLAYAYITEAVGDLATVEMQLWPDDPDRLPLVVVSTSVPAPLGNGPRDLGARFDIVCSVYAEGVEAAYDLARRVHHNCHQLWRGGYRTDYGGIAHIDRNSTRPHRVALDIESGGAYRFDFDLGVVARGTTYSF